MVQGYRASPRKKNRQGTRGVAFKSCDKGLPRISEREAGVGRGGRARHASRSRGRSLDPPHAQRPAALSCSPFSEPHPPEESLPPGRLWCGCVRSGGGVDDRKFARVARKGAHASEDVLPVAVVPEAVDALGRVRRDDPGHLRKRPRGQRHGAPPVETRRPRVVRRHDRVHGRRRPGGRRRKRRRRGQRRGRKRGRRRGDLCADLSVVRPVRRVVPELCELVLLHGRDGDARGVEGLWQLEAARRPRPRPAHAPPAPDRLADLQRAVEPRHVACEPVAGDANARGKSSGRRSMRRSGVGAVRVRLARARMRGSGAILHIAVKSVAVEPALDGEKGRVAPQVVARAGGLKHGRDAVTW